VPAGVTLEYGSDDFVSHEDAGIRAFRDCAVVLVAGGLGERLGYSVRRRRRHCRRRRRLWWRSQPPRRQPPPTAAAAAAALRAPRPAGN